MRQQRPRRRQKQLLVERRKTPLPGCEGSCHTQESAVQQKQRCNAALSGLGRQVCCTIDGKRGAALGPLRVDGAGHKRVVPAHAGHSVQHFPLLTLSSVACKRA